MVGYDTIPGVNLSTHIRYALATLLLFAFATAGCGLSNADNMRQLVVASGENGIFVFDSVNGEIYELKKIDRRTGAYRTLPYHAETEAVFLPVTQTEGDAVAKFYTTDSTGVTELSIIKGKDSYTWETTPADFRSEGSLIAAYGDEFILLTDDGVSISSPDDVSNIQRPDGNFATPVAARNGSGGWVIVWPEKLAIEKGTERFGLGKPGRFRMQVIALGGTYMEYGFENTTFIETRARSLIGATVDPEGRLVLLDDKGYLSAYNGTNMLSNVFGQISPSKFAVNTMAPGPEGTVIVTDAVGRVVSMIDPMTGDVSCSWRLPKVRVKTIGTVLGIGSVIFDIILVVIIVILVVRIRARIRRHQQYRSEDSK